MPLRKAFLFSALILSTGCSSVSGGDGASSAAASTTGLEALVPFCGATATASDTSSVRTQFWSAAQVQSEVNATANLDGFRCTPHKAYVVAYARMTKARDTNRCTEGDPMYPPTELDTRLNDALSDLMSRNYIGIVRQCLASNFTPMSGSGDLGGLFCELHAEAQRDDWDAVRVALGTTSLYLTTNITLALSALPHIDALWVGTPFQTIEQRVARLQQYKPTYDAFNSFLAGSVGLVADALNDAGLLRNGAFTAIASFVSATHISQLPFGSLRDDGFASALRIASLTPLGQHPWTSRDSTGNMAMAGTVTRARPFPKVPALTAELETVRSRAAFHRNNSTTGLVGILQGQTFSSMAAAGNCDN